MKTRNYLQVMLALIAAAFLAACASTEQAQKSAPSVVSGVAVVTVHSAPTPEYYEAVGTVKSDVTSVLGAEISGTVKKILVKEGDHVRSGQVLALIDSRVQKAQLEAAAAGIEESNQGLVEVKQALQAAEAQRKFAEATFKRYKALLSQKSAFQECATAGGSKRPAPSFLRLSP